MEENNEKKLSYEELMKVASMLQAQNNELKLAISQIKRLDYLLKVLEYSHLFSEKFVNSCISEIETTIELPDTTTESSETTNAE